MNITTEQIKQLREKCGAGVMECRRALEETLGDIDKAEELLRKQGLEIAEKKKERELKSGVIECYSHAGGRVVSVVELLSETDFVARNEEFKAIAHELAMQVAAMNPKDTEELLAQPYIRDPKKTVGDLVNELVGKIRENIQVGRIARFELGA
jgi:elongation factor Ts